jgi:hypothetical protein
VNENESGVGFEQGKLLIFPVLVITIAGFPDTDKHQELILTK